MKGKKVEFVWVLVTLVLGAGLGIGGATLSRQTRPEPIIIQPPAPTVTPAPSATPAPIRVYVSGQVRQEAVYKLPADSIVADAVEAAGGFAANAAQDHVNLAQPLVDGAHVHIPHRDDTDGKPPAALNVPSETDSQPVKININAANLEQLDTLPGVGPVTAQEIIDYRQQNGPFATIEDIMDVAGIGPAKFEDMKELITVD